MMKSQIYVIWDCTILLSHGGSSSSDSGNPQFFDNKDKQKIVGTLLLNSSAWVLLSYVLHTFISGSAEDGKLSTHPGSHWEAVSSLFISHFLCVSIHPKEGRGPVHDNGLLRSVFRLLAISVSSDWHTCILTIFFAFAGLCSGSGSFAAREVNLCPTFNLHWKWFTCTKLGN